MGRTGRGSMGLAVGLAAALAAASAHAQSPAEFFKGKTVTINVGFGPGGGYDLNTRMVARHFGKYIPGNPSVIVQNMPGGGSIVSANYIYSAAPRDGTVLAVFGASIMLEPLFGNKNVKVEPDKLAWIGNMHSDINSCGIWKGGGEGIKTFDDLLKSKKTIVFGSTSPESETGRFPYFMHHVFKAPVKVINGYKGTKDINLALQNGEVHASCGMYEASVLSSYANELKNGDLKIIFQAGLDRKVPLFGDAASAGDLLKGEEMRQIGEIVFRASEITRPVAAPPGTPPDRIAALRKALMDTMKDPELTAEAKKIGFEFLPMTGERIGELMAGFYKTPPAVVKKALDMMAEPK
jgi:tripartite-type tricarboxylate transporter receptor subunit TctC